MAFSQTKIPIRHAVSRWFLGPGTTFRNGNRNWLYLVYLGAVLALLAAIALKH